ncbi:TetR/AcrR family transcriptional regulator [Paenibacillus hexagrammi]|uniref:TetR/AcrR family transcriptional regulator n=1 Tax=Paenibacillus hexagrammi TaxID=2908839 RepID=A0ABY3SHH8_9BACL|nr:TetR/AcrR family transcriptional regulator [Paenibacillus sp. YPD9-1]UJF32938.1 TetR/AcrR family transcriptional regulator [Paenibacillus sp. YPD9-1]
MTGDSNQRNSSFQLILDTTEQLIKEKGCRQTTLQDIIDRTGLSKGAIYHYVSGKDELYGLILKSKIELVNDRFQETISKPIGKTTTPPLQMLTKNMLAQDEQREITNKIFTYLMSQSDNPKVSEVLTELFNYSVMMSRNWIQAGQEAGAIPQELDATRIASIFTTFNYGLRVQSVIAKDSEFALQEEDVFGFLFRSLR